MSPYTEWGCINLVRSSQYPDQGTSKPESGNYGDKCLWQLEAFMSYRKETYIKMLIISFFDYGHSLHGLKD